MNKSNRESSLIKRSPTKPQAKVSKAPLARGAIAATAPVLARLQWSSHKLKTRQAILAAASEMAAQGQRPTVAEAAERAGISRATAYRYFPSREFLVIEMALPVDEVRKALSQVAHDDPALRVGTMVRTVANWCYDHQLVLREMLRVSLAPESDGAEYHRPSNRLDVIARQLKPLQSVLSPADYDRLALALTLLLGVEPIVVMQDVARVPREQAIETLVWMASSLVAASTHPG